MSSGPILEMLVTGAVAVATWYGVRARRASHEDRPLDVRSFRRRDIADFPRPGAGKISGHVRPHESHQLWAPVSGTACAAYQVRVILGQPGHEERSWVAHRLLASDERIVSFLVEDSSGAALVRPDSPELLLHERLVAEMSTDAPLPPRLARLLEDVGPLPEGWRLRFDSMVAVVGHGEADTSAPDGEGGYRQAMSRLALGPLEDGQMLVSNLSFNPPE